MIWSILGIIFDNKNCGVIPIRTGRDCFHNPAKRKIIIGELSFRLWSPRART
jgi:hypothetical protein